MNRFLLTNCLLLLAFCSFEQWIIYTPLRDTVSSFFHFQWLPVLGAIISLAVPLAAWLKLRKKHVKMLSAEVIALLVINPFAFYQIALMSDYDTSGLKWDVSLLAGPDTLSIRSRPGAVIAAYWFPYIAILLNRS